MQVNALFSYAYADTKQGDPGRVLAAVPDWAPTPRVLLDSGAFSAYQRGITVTVPDLVAWYKSQAHLDPICAGLDVMYDREATHRNCDQMRAAGADVFPTVHLGADPQDVALYAADGWTRVALGGLVNRRVPIGARSEWIRACQRVAAEHGVMLHGFGWSPNARRTLDTVRRFDTVDSTSWNRGTKYGTAPLVDGFEVRAIPVADKSTVLRLLGQDRRIRPEAVLSMLMWGNKNGKGRSHHMYALSGYAFLHWGELIGTPVYLAAPSRQMLEALFGVVIRPHPTTEGATA